jgi:hypothetical protein
MVIVVYYAHHNTHLLVCFLDFVVVALETLGFVIKFFCLFFSLAFSFSILILFLISSIILFCLIIFSLFLILSFFNHIYF